MTTEPTDDDLLAEAIDWRLRIDQAPQDEGLRQQLASWLADDAAHRDAYRDVEWMTRLARALPPDYAARYARDGRSPSPRRTASPLRRRLLAGSAIALAACLAFIFAPTARLWMEADHRTAAAELRRLVLEDGSVVFLDAASAIAVRYSPARREVALLSGRAYFEVTPAATRPFVVTTDDLTVTVTGTAFDVDLSPESTSVTVRSGRVEVSPGDHSRQPAILGRGERVAFERKSGNLSRASVDPADVASWRERRLIVDRARLGDVVAELGRHYPGLVMMRDELLAERPVSGVFDLRAPLEAMQAVVRTHGGTVMRITPYVVVILGP
jgi:transmembrane sensor